MKLWMWVALGVGAYVVYQMLVIPRPTVSSALPFATDMNKSSGTNFSITLRAGNGYSYSP